MMKKNVAIIIQKLRGGGAERTAANLSLCLKDNYNIHLIVFDASNPTYPFMGVLHDLKIPPAKGKLGKIINIYRRIVAVKRIKQKERIDVSISLLDNANYVNVMSKTTDRIITSIRNQVSKRNGNNWQTLRRLKTVIKRMDCMVSLSKGVENDLIENYGVPKEKIITIYNPCDGDLLKEKTSSHFTENIEMPSKSIVTMGRLNRQKGQWHLLRAFTVVVKKIPDAHLYILGEGELRDQLEIMVGNLKIKENVHFMGYIESPHAFILKGRAFVFPSLYEGLGNVLLEAMACGIPCISTDCHSGPREILAPETKVKENLDSMELCEFGILTSVGDEAHFNAIDPITKDENQLAEAMITILIDENLYEHYSKKSKERSLDFTPDKITRKWCELIG